MQLEIATKHVGARATPTRMQQQPRLGLAAKNVNEDVLC